MDPWRSTPQPRADHCGLRCEPTTTTNGLHRSIPSALARALDKLFGRRGYTHEEGKDNIPIQETLLALNELVTAGKVRTIGLSNETPWGMHEYLRLAEVADLPRVVSIQNPYNLLNRTFEVGLAEMAIREQVGLLAYSPLAFGMLTGKYENGARPENARLTRWERFSRYSS